MSDLAEAEVDAEVGTALEPVEAPRATVAYTGRQKAAAMLVSLGPEKAAEIMRFMPDEEVEQLSADMAEIYRVDPGVSEALYEELYIRMAPGSEVALGGLEYTREVLENLLGPQRADEIISLLQARGEVRPFEFLRRTPPEQIYTLLKDEAPQTIALVIASLWPSVAGQVLTHLPPEVQAEIAVRIATMKETNPGVIGAIDQGLRQKISAISTAEFHSPGGVDALADILNNAGRSTERHVIEHLAASDPELADEVRMKLFTFEDLSVLEDRDMQLILREVEGKDLVLALRGVPDDLVNKFLSNMSERAAQTLREDMEVMPPQRRTVVEEAQGKIVAIVRRLDEEGTIVLPRGEDEGGGEVL
ncbi:MAG: flagellar motor switch protein FliG [Solirubrobacteraceae bacterium]|nr:flagellar motor switch protein FliG [Solirubrobacteraceae bacterium]